MSFVVGDCRSIPLNNKSIDFIVSFETIEHIEHQEEMVGELLRVLRPGGLVIVSTPDRENYSEQTGLVNPHHVQEMTHAQFVRLFREKFAHVRVFRQRLAIASFLLEDKPARQGTLQSFMLGSRGEKPGSRPLRASMYSIVVCGDSAEAVKSFESSIHLDPEDDLFLKQEKVLRWASGLHKEHEIIKTRIREKDVTIADEKKAREGVNETAKRLAAALDNATRECFDSDSRHAEAMAQLLQRERELTAALDDATQSLSGLEERYSQNVAQLLQRERELTATVDYATRSLSGLEEQYSQTVAQLSQRERELKTALDAMTRECSGVEARHRQAVAQLMQRERELATIREEGTSRLTRAKVVAEAFEEELAAARAEAAATEGALAAAKATADRFERELAGIRKTADALARGLAAASARAEAAERERRATKAAVRTLKRELAEISGDKTAADERLAAHLQKSASALAGVATDLVAREEELSVRRHKLLRLHNDAERLKSAIALTARRGAEARELSAFLDGCTVAARVLGRLRRHFALKMKKVIREVAKSNLLDSGWYFASYRDVRTGKLTPIEHYARIGWRKDHNPSLFFDTRWYRSRGFPTNIDPLYHYISIGWREGRDPHPLFSTKWYLHNEPDTANDVTPLSHYLKFGWREGRDPHPLFRSSWYRDDFPELEAIGVSPLEHYLRAGWREGRDPHPLFSVSWYLESNPDVRDAGVEPLAHYLDRGDREGRRPHPLFDADYWRKSGANSAAADSNALIAFVTGDPKISCHPLFDSAWYLLNNPDVAVSGTNAISHYLQIGWRQGRDPHPLFSVKWYLDKNADVVEAGVEPLTHYVRYGDREGRRPHPVFDPNHYRATTSDANRDGVNALVHFLGNPGGSPHSVFDASWQAATDSNIVGVDHLLHCIERGERASRGRPKVPSDLALPEAASARALVSLELRNLLKEEYGAACAERVPNYFGSIFDLERYQPGHPKRVEILASQIGHLKELAKVRTHDRPVEISIIVPVYNHIEYTLACVQSILEHPTKHRYEIIIGNDVSEDETEATFMAVDNLVRVITHPVKRGFLRNCNLCAKQAAGRYIVLLNNDTFVLDGWLDALIEPFEMMKSIGLVGSKLLMADGRLQEAGGILWKDGSAWNFGRNQDPRLPEFNYLKDADYISAASIAVPLSVWKDVRGFDERYSPAYCEDSDLAFALRARGYRTIYQPLSAVIHHEGVSHGTDTSAGAKGFQITNAMKFLEKWGEVLSAEHFSNGEETFVARDRSAKRPHILVIDHYVPQPDKDAGSKTMFQYLKLLVNSNFQITFWPDNLFYDRHYAQTLQILGIEVIYGRRFLDKFDDWMSMHGKYFQYVLLSRAHIATKYIESIRRHSQAKILFYGHDISVLRLEQKLKLSWDSKVHEEMNILEKLENKIWQSADVIYYPADFECAYLRQRFPDKVIRQIPAYLYPQNRPQAPRVHTPNDSSLDLIYVGGFRHPPNADAMLWFCREVLPVIRKAIPDISLRIVGSFPPPEVEALACDNVLVTGYVSDEALDEFYDSSIVAVVPLRYGGGIKGKLIEAFVHGVPIVTTSVGLQGLDAARNCVELADDAASFAQSVVRLFGDAARRRFLAEQGRAFVAQNYSHEAAVKALAPDIPEIDQLKRRARSAGYLPGQSSALAREQLQGKK